MLRTGNSLTVALDLTRSQFKNRYTTSEYLVGNLRSAYAPEQHYPSPGITSVAGLFNASGAALTSDMLKVGEFLTLGTMDFGADRLVATPFELAADAGIRELVDRLPGGVVEGFGITADMLTGGEDYQLIPFGNNAGRPTYRVMMRDARTDRYLPLQDPDRPGVPLTLDVGQKYDRIVKVDGDLKALDQIAKLNMPLEKQIEAVAAGETPEYRAFLLEHYRAKLEGKGKK
jgi:hypothetical protein